MRKLVYAINLTLDGCCDPTKVTVPEEDLMTYYARLVGDADTFLYGRVTYQFMVPYRSDSARNPPESESKVQTSTSPRHSTPSARS